MTPAEALAAAADVGVDVAGARATALAGGYTNESWRIDGSGAPVVVRRYGRLHLDASGIGFEHALIAHVAARCDLVRAPLHDPTGATFRRGRDGMVAVFPWIPGTTGARDAATAANAARALARFHRAARDLHVADGTRSTRILGILPWLHATFKEFAGRPLLARALPWNDLIVALGAATIRLAPRARALPIVIVHGDPNPENVVVGAGGMVHGLIDFDFAQETERIYDVAALVDEFARASDDAPVDLDRLARIVEAYAEDAPLSDAERSALADAMLRHAAFLTWYVVTRHGERSPGDVGGAPRYARRVREIARLAAEISERVGLRPAP